MTPQTLPQLISSTEFERIREASEILRHEAQTILDLSRRLDSTFSDACTLLLECEGSVAVTGIGKAGLIGQKIAATFSSMGIRAFFLHPAEAIHGDLGSLSSRDLILAISNSGETEEISRLIPCLKQLSLSILAITSNPASTLGRAASVTLAMGTISEAGTLGLAPTASTTAMLVLGDALALVVSRIKGFTRQNFSTFHPGGKLGRQLTCAREVMRPREQLRVASETLTVREALVHERRSGRRTGAVALVNEHGQLTGLFTDSDLVRLVERREESALDRPMRDVMTRDPITIGADHSVQEAIEILARRHISELPVIDAQGCPVGMIDITDLIGASGRPATA